MAHTEETRRARAPRSDRLTALVMEGSAVGTALYWVEYFTTGRARRSGDPAYLVFEDAFPLADGYMIVCLVAGARALRRQRESAVLWGVAAGSAMVYLAAMDTLYNLENGKYAERTPDMAIEAGVNLWTWIVGPLVMRRSWRARRRLAPQ